jgi:hypothetical protein
MATPTQAALEACVPYGGIYPGSDPSIYVEPDPSTPDQTYSWKISCLRINAREQYDCTGGAERETVCSVRSLLAPNMTCPDRYKNPATGECDANFQANAITGQMELIPATKPWHYGYVAPLALPDPQTGGAGTGAGGTGTGAGKGGTSSDAGAPEPSSKLPWIIAGLVAVALAGGGYYLSTRSTKGKGKSKGKGKK